MDKPCVALLNQEIQGIIDLDIAAISIYRVTGAIFFRCTKELEAVVQRDGTCKFKVLLKNEVIS